MRDMLVAYLRELPSGQRILVVEDTSEWPPADWDVATKKIEEEI